MFFFAKSEYKTVDMPFALIETEDDLEAGIISIEAAGFVDGEKKFFYASFSLKKHSMYYDGTYEEVLDNLRAVQGREILIALEYKKNKLKKFKIDLESFASVCVDDRLKDLDLLGYGINDSSLKEKLEADNF